MAHIAEYLLELSVLDPERLDEAQWEEIREHSPQCALCGGLIDYFRSFYREMESRRGEPSLAAERFLNSLGPPPNIIVFRPFVYRLERTPRSTTVLAALTDEPTRRFHTVATLASEEQRALIRITHDRTEDTFTLSVHSSDRVITDHAIVSFPELPAEFVTNAGGRVVFSLPASADAKKLGSSSCILASAVAEFRIPGEDTARPGEGTVSEFRPSRGDSRFRLRISRAGERMSLEIGIAGEGNDPGIRRALVSPEGHGNILLDLEMGRAMCDRAADIPGTTIRLYS